MKTKYVCHGLIYLHVNFHENRTMRTEILIIKNCRWGGGGKEKESKTSVGQMIACYKQNIHLLPFAAVLKSLFVFAGGGGGIAQLVITGGGGGGE